jgi:hypothetical protein
MQRIALILICGLAACQTLPDGERVRVIGAIEGYNQDDPRITVPATVRAGDDFDVTISTYGSGCHTRGETEVARQARTATITPYDYTAPPGTPCTLQLIEFRHTARVRFDTPGPAEIVVRGESRTADGVIEVRRNVNVQPRE